MSKSSGGGESVRLPDEVLHQGRTWARLADLQARAVRRFGRIGVVIIITAVLSLASLLANLLIVLGSNPAELRLPANYLRPVIIPAAITPLMLLPMMNLLEHFRHLSVGYRYLAEHDPLTGVHNRNGLYQLAAALRPDTVVVLADVDKFKNVNDRYGHSEGDKLLLAVVSDLRDLCGQACAIARIGGDEFVVLIDPEVAQDVHVPNEILVSTGKAAVRVTLGCAALVDDLDAAIAEADLAMYRSKPARTDPEPAERRHDESPPSMISDA